MLWIFQLSSASLGVQQVAAPQGWDALQVTLSRGSAHGLFTELWGSLTFGQDGYHYLSSLYANLGPSTAVLLSVAQRYATGPGPIIFQQALNLASAIFKEGITVSCTLQDPLQALLPTEAWVQRVNLLGGKTIQGIPLAPATPGVALSLQLPALGSAAAGSCTAVLAYEALNCAVQAASENQLSCLSNYLGRTDASPNATAADGPGAATALTTGFLLRGLPPQHLTTSLQELLAGLSAIYALGWGLETYKDKHVLRVEPIRYFYNHQNLVVELNLTDAVSANLRQEPNPALQFAELRTGYAAWQADVPGASEAFCVPVRYTTGQPGLTLEKTCAFVAAQAAVQALRLLPYTPGTSPNHPLDAYTFVLPVVRNGGGWQVATGVPASSHLSNPSQVLGWRLSPWTMAARWWGWVGNTFTTPSTGKLVLTSHEGNDAATGGPLVDVTYNLLDLEVAEPTQAHSEADALVGAALTNTAGARCVQPWLTPTLLSFTASLSFTQFSKLRAQPTGLVRVHTSSTAWVDGFLQQLTYTPATGMAQFQLLPYSPS